MFNADRLSSAKFQNIVVYDVQAVVNFAYYLTGPVESVEIRGSK